MHAYIYIYKQNLALNNLKRLRCHKTKSDMSSRQFRCSTNLQYGETHEILKAEIEI